MAYYYPIPLIGNFLFFLQWFLIANSLFERRFSRAVTWLGELAAFGLNIFLGSVLPYMSLIRALNGIPFCSWLPRFGRCCTPRNFSSRISFTRRRFWREA